MATKKANIKPRFNDLEWEPHFAGVGGRHAMMEFRNGYMASVVCGDFFYSNGVDTYELAVMRGTKENPVGPVYDTPITDDVIERITADEVEKILGDIAALPKVSKVKR